MSQKNGPDQDKPKKKRDRPQIIHSEPQIMGGRVEGYERPAGVPAPPPKPVDPTEEPVQLAEATGPQGIAPKIVTFGQDRKHEEEWNRTPNTTGTGAIHVRTFHCKLTDDAVIFMDQTINEWLDSHPEYEVKFVTSAVGTMTGKLKEPNLFCQVWV